MCFRPVSREAKRQRSRAGTALKLFRHSRTEPALTTEKAGTLVITQGQLSYTPVLSIGDRALDRIGPEKPEEAPGDKDHAHTDGKQAATLPPNDPRNEK
jgi:hypothetical protein